MTDRTPNKSRYNETPALNNVDALFPDSLTPDQFGDRIRDIYAVVRNLGDAAIGAIGTDAGQNLVTVNLDTDFSAGWQYYARDAAGNPDSDHAGIVFTYRINHSASARTIFQLLFNADGDLQGRISTAENFTGIAWQGLGSGGAGMQVQVPNATDTVAGIIRIATDAEASAGQSNSITVTPAQVRDLLDAIALLPGPQGPPGPAGPPGSGGITSVATDSTISGDGTSSDPLSVVNEFTSAEKSKLSGIETGAEVNVGVEYTQTEKTKLAGIDAGAEANIGVEYTQAEKTKLGGIEEGADVNDTASEIVTKLSGLSGNARLPASAVRDLPSGSGEGLSTVATDSTISGDGSSDNPLSVVNEFTAAEKTKLGGIESGAQVNVGVEYTQTEKTKLDGIEAGAEANIGVEYTQAEKTKLGGIESGADVNDTAAEIVTKLESLSGNARLSIGNTESAFRWRCCSSYIHQGIYMDKCNDCINQHEYRL